MTVRFLEIAEIELDEAVSWYGAQAPGLGDTFLIEVLSAKAKRSGGATPGKDACTSLAWTVEQWHAR